MTYSDQNTVMEDVLQTLRWFGPYQRIQFFMTMIPVLACALHIMSVIFIGRPVKHQCAAVDSLNLTIQEDGFLRTYDVMKNHSQYNFTVTYRECSIDVNNGNDTIMTTSCVSGYQYEEPADRSFVSQFDLVCQRESLSDVSQTLLAFGMMFGAFGFTALSDRFGRKPMYMLSHFCLFIVAIATAFSPNVTIFFLLRFLIGAFQQGVGLTSNIMLVELLPKARRSLNSQVGCFGWSASLMILCLIAYLTRNISWHYTELIFAACSAYVLFQWWITDESIRWLVTNERHKEVERILRKAAKANNVDFQTVMSVLNRGRRPATMVSVTITSKSISEDDQITLSTDGQITEKNDTNFGVLNGDVSTTRIKPADDMRLSAFVKNKRVFMVTAISCYMWFTDSVTYYGLLMTSSSLADSPYMGFFLSVLAEMPSNVVFTVCVDRIGRKRCLVIFHILSSLSLLTTTVLSNLPAAGSVPGINVIILCITLLGKFAVSTSFSVLWLYTAELFPTNLRNTGFGVASLAARIGGMVAPYSRTFSRHLPWGPGAVFTTLCIIVPVLMRFLPETAGQELPQTLEDFEKLFERKDKPNMQKMETK